MNIKTGSLVKITLPTESIEGRLITEDPFTIKLSSGYNIILEKKDIKGIKVLEAPKDKPIIHPQRKPKTGKKITILHTGGTIASKVDYTTGAVIAQFSPEDIIGLFPEIQDLAEISSRLISNIQSEMMRFSHYNQIAEAAAEEIEKGAEGIIITHGTDTLHYTAAALTFILENPPIPIILVGSQRSSDRPSSDAKTNLISAITFATNTEWTGVAICMHETTEDTSCLILPGTKTRKMHTTRRDAFKPINIDPIARITGNKIEQLTLQTGSQGAFTLKKINENLKVGLFKSRTHMFADELLFYEKYDGLIIEGFALGHMPTEKIDKHTDENIKIYDAIKKLAKKMPVAFASQCIYGRVNMNVYTPGRELISAGVIGNQCDMTPETAYIKLAWLLSHNKKDKIKELFEKNLREEISERSVT
ncbi:MAG: Glu-tRNA(Gln) amidotransferase subunit GatD [Nanoarchaeota archaeon]